MYLDKLIAQQRWSKYQLSKLSQIPYATLNDLFNGKTSLMRSNAETVYKLAKAFDLSMEELIMQSTGQIENMKKIDPELFKSNLQHEIKTLGAQEFIERVSKRDLIFKYHQKQWMFETLYLLATLDYLCRINHIAMISKYDGLRKLSLSNIFYPSSLVLASKLKNDPRILQRSFEQSIVEFKHFNIVEMDLSDVA